MDDLNYRHLRYFREVAHEGHLTRAAERLNLSQSALSAQIRALEARLGHPLFDRVGRKLVVTEVGRIALDHADRIFDTGAELIATLRRTGDASPPLRVGAISTLSRNFQLLFLRDVLHAPNIRLALRSGDADGLLAALAALALDVVLTTEPPPSAEGRTFIAHQIAEQAVHLHGAPARLRGGDLGGGDLGGGDLGGGDLQTLITREPLILPSQGAVRRAFDSLVAQLGATPRIAAEVDDMAMIRLLAREDVGLALAPSVVLADEIAAGRVATADAELGIVESFYAVTVARSFPHPSLAALLGATPPVADAARG